MARDGREDGTAREVRRTAGENAFVVRALAKGLSILGLFDAENREWTLDEIAEGAGLPRMTAYRMIRTMESARYLVRDPVTNRYHLGPGAARHHVSHPTGTRSLPPSSGPICTELAEKTGEAATLAIEVDGVAVERRHGRHRPSLPARGGAGPHHRRHGQRQRQGLRGLQDRRREGGDPRAALILS